MVTDMVKVARRMFAVGVLAALASAPAAAQDSSRTLGLDPYKPSDAKLLRDIGPTVATQMSLEELSKLDPYKPSDAALLRQLGGGVPACCLGYFWPIAPIGAGPMPIATRPSLADVARSMAPSRPDPSNVVWVCRESACAARDLDTHEFSTPPAVVPAPPAPAIAAPVGQQ